MEKRGRKPKRKEVSWSPEMAYAVGLMATDGNLSPDGRHLVFVSKDYEQVVNLKSCLRLSASIKSYPTERSQGFHYRLQWSDTVLYRFLNSIGLYRNKSLTIGALHVPDEYFFDFLRGAFDGDGSFYSYFDKRWKDSFMFYLCFTTASETHVLWLREVVERLCGVKGHIAKARLRSGNAIYSLRYAKNESIVLLFRLYQCGDSTCLTRKRLKVEGTLRIVGLSLSKT